MSWQDKWEAYALQEREKYRSEDVSGLVDAVRKGRWGNYYTLWYVLAERATAVEAVGPLFMVVSGDADYLYKYHAAAALLKLTGIDCFKPVDISGSHAEVTGNLDKLRTMLEEKGYLEV